MSNFVVVYIVFSEHNVEHLLLLNIKLGPHTLAMFVINILYEQLAKFSRFQQISVDLISS